MMSSFMTQQPIQSRECSRGSLR